MPQLGYQLQWGSNDRVIESYTKDKTGIRNFLNAVFGGCTPDGKLAFTAELGLEFDKLSTLNQSSLLEAHELDFYVEEFSRNGLRGPCEHSFMR